MYPGTIHNISNHFCEALIYFIAPRIIIVFIILKASSKITNDEAEWWDSTACSWHAPSSPRQKCQMKTKKKQF